MYVFGLRHALNGFTVACEYPGMNIKISKTAFLHLFRNFIQFSLSVGEVLLKQVEHCK